MEKIFLDKRLVVVAFFTVFATTTVTTLSSSNDFSVPVELRFIRWIKNQPVFQLNFSGNTQHDDFTIIIKDEFNNVLSAENIKAENFSKAFLLNTDEIGDNTLIFEAISKKTNASKQFRINRHTFEQEETA